MTESNETNPVATNPNPGASTADQIKAVIEEKINPMLALHAGGCEFVDFKEGVVTLKMFGGCSGCPSSAITLFNGIVPILQENVDGIEDVVLD